MHIYPIIIIGSIITSSKRHNDGKRPKLIAKCRFVPRKQNGRQPVICKMSTSLPLERAICGPRRVRREEHGCVLAVDDNPCAYLLALEALTTAVYQPYERSYLLCLREMPSNNMLGAAGEASGREHYLPCLSSQNEVISLRSICAHTIRADCHRSSTRMSWPLLVPPQKWRIRQLMCPVAAGQAISAEINLSSPPRHQRGEWY